MPSQTTALALHGDKLVKGKVCYKLPRLEPGKQHVFTLTLRANGSAHGSIRDGASADATNANSARTKLQRPIAEVSLRRVQKTASPART